MTRFVLFLGVDLDSSPVRPANYGDNIEVLTLAGFVRIVRTEPVFVCGHGLVERWGQAREDKRKLSPRFSASRTSASNPLNGWVIVVVSPGSRGARRAHTPRM